MSAAPARLSAFRTLRAAAFAAALAAAPAAGPLLLSACGGASRSASTSRDAVVLLDCNVPDASLFVDGRFLAPVSLVRGGIALSPGVHRLELRHDAYLGRFLQLNLLPAERIRVDAQLFPILP